MLKKTTIYDVAREAEVSLATVSRVINGSNVVKEKTKEKVLEVIERLDFKPNEVARGLAMSKTTSIAIIFPQSMFGHTQEMLGGLGDTSRHLDYNVSFYTTDNIGGDTIKDVSERVIKSRVDGVVLFNNEFVDEMIEGFQKYKLPVVVIGKKISGDSIGSIYFDSRQVACQLVDEMLKSGRKKVLYLAARENLIDNHEVIKGIEEAHRSNGLLFDKSNSILSMNDYQKDYDNYKKCFENNKYDAVFCGYDKDAIALSHVLSDLNLSVPLDVCVAGLLNTEYATAVRPAITSVNVAVYSMGAMAVRLLTKILNQEEIESKEIAAMTMVVKRESTNF